MSTDSEFTKMATESNPSVNITIGARLKSARESRGLQQQEVADELKLNKKFILMIEDNNFPPDLPVTFIRGYIRSYAKLLEIPEHEVKKGLEPIKPEKVIPVVLPPPPPAVKRNHTGDE